MRVVQLYRFGGSMSLYLHGQTLGDRTLVFTMHERRAALLAWYLREALLGGGPELPGRFCGSLGGVRIFARGDKVRLVGPRRAVELTKEETQRLLEAL